MSKQKKTNKKPPRRPHVSRLSWMAAITGSKNFTEAEKARLLTPINEAFEALRKGELTRANWVALSAVVNVGICLGVEGIGPNFRPVYDATAQVMMDLRRQVLEQERATAYAAQLKQIDEALFLFRTQLDLCTLREYMRASERIQYYPPVVETSPEQTRHTFMRYDVDTPVATNV